MGKILTWMLSNLKIAVILSTTVIIPLVGFAYAFYGKVIESEKANISQQNDINDLKINIYEMRGNLNSIKEDTSAIKSYFMKRAVEK